MKTRKMETACYDGVAYITIDNPELLNEFIRIVEEAVKSMAFNNNFKEAAFTIQFLLSLYNVRKKLAGEDINVEDS